MAEDHQHAKQIAEALHAKDFTGTISPVETNIILFEVKDRFTPKELVKILASKGIQTIAMTATQVRMVVHLDITPEMVQQTIRVIEAL